MRTSSWSTGMNVEWQAFREKTSVVERIAAFADEFGWPIDQSDLDRFGLCEVLNPTSIMYGSSASDLAGDFFVVFIYEMVIVAAPLVTDRPAFILPTMSSPEWKRFLAHRTGVRERNGIALRHDADGRWKGRLCSIVDNGLSGSSEADEPVEAD